MIFLEDPETMTAHLAASARLDNMDSAEHLACTVRAWHLLAETVVAAPKAKIKRYLIHHTHRLLMAHSWSATLHPDIPGRLRLAGYLDISTKLDNWLRAYNKGEATAHHLYVEWMRIGPFADGNGQLGRMFLWLSQIRAGRYPIYFADHKEYALWVRQKATVQ